MRPSRTRTRRAKLGTITNHDGTPIVVTYYPSTRTLEFRPFKARHSGPSRSRTCTSCHAVNL